MNAIEKVGTLLLYFIISIPKGTVGCFRNCSGLSRTSP